MKCYIAKKTENIRYKIVSYLMKKLTPVLYKKIDMEMFLNNRIIQLTKDTIPAEIRPSIKFMKELFDGKLVKGAEIGVERGKNSENILKELNIKKLYLVDIWTSYEEIYIIWSETNYNQVLRKFRKNEKVEIIKDYSAHAADEIENNSLDFVYIDANHKYKYVYQDIKLWFPKIKDGGIIAGHDIMLKIDDNYEVLNAVKYFCFEHGIKFYIKEPDWYFIKPEKENKKFSGKFYYKIEPV